MAEPKVHSPQLGEEDGAHEWPEYLLARRKPLLRVVCPICAQVVTVNALDRGVTKVPCSKCEGRKTTIIIEADEDGGIIDIHGEHKEKPAATFDWKTGAIIGLLFIIVLLLAYRISPSAPAEKKDAPTDILAPSTRNGSGMANPAETSERPFSDIIQDAPNVINKAGGKAIENKIFVPTPSVSASPLTPDMFAPEQKR
jgi:hypothetical protein